MTVTEDKTDLSKFKTKIKSWTCSQYPSKLHQKYINHIGLILAIQFELT